MLLPTPIAITFYIQNPDCQYQKLSFINLSQHIQAYCFDIAVLSKKMLITHPPLNALIAFDAKTHKMIQTPFDLLKIFRSNNNPDFVFLVHLN